MDLSASTVIRRPVDDVYAFVMDLDNDARWRTGVDLSAWRDGQSVGVGAEGFTRAGKAEVGWRVITYEPGSRIEWELLGPGPYRGTGGYLFETVAEGTRFTLVAQLEPAGVYRLLGPVFGRVGRKQNAADVGMLRELIEQGG